VQQMPVGLVAATDIEHGPSTSRKPRPAVTNDSADLEVDDLPHPKTSPRRPSRKRTGIRVGNESFAIVPD